MTNKTITEIITSMKKDLEPNQRVMVRRLGDDKEYRAIVAGLYQNAATCDFYILEMVDRISDSKWSHQVIISSCIDEEEWSNEIRQVDDHIKEEIDRVYGKDGGLVKPTPPPTRLVTEGAKPSPPKNRIVTEEGRVIRGESSNRFWGKSSTDRKSTGGGGVGPY